MLHCFSSSSPLLPWLVISCVHTATAERRIAVAAPHTLRFHYFCEQNAFFLSKTKHHTNPKLCENVLIGGRVLRLQPCCSAQAITRQCYRCAIFFFQFDSRSVCSGASQKVRLRQSFWNDSFSFSLILIMSDFQNFLLLFHSSFAHLALDSLVGWYRANAFGNLIHKPTLARDSITKKEIPIKTKK